MPADDCRVRSFCLADICCTPSLRPLWRGGRGVSLRVRSRRRGLVDSRVSTTLAYLLLGLSDQFDVCNTKGLASHRYVFAALRRVVEVHGGFLSPFDESAPETFSTDRPPFDDCMDTGSDIRTWCLYCSSPHLFERPCKVFLGQNSWWLSLWPWSRCTSFVSTTSCGNPCNRQA